MRILLTGSSGFIGKALTPIIEKYWEVHHLRSDLTEYDKVKQEVKDLSEGLRDTVKAVAEELEIKPALLTKAISVAFKESLDAEKQDIEELEELLAVAKQI